MDDHSTKMLVYYLLVTSCLIFSLGFIYLVVEKVEDVNSVKIPYASLILFLISTFIQFLVSLSSSVNILYKIFWFLTFISIVVYIFVKIKSGNKDNFCNRYKPYKLSDEYEQYYKKVMNRNQYDLIQPYKEAFEKDLPRIN